MQEEGIKPNPNAPKKKNRKNNTPRSRSASPKKNKNRNERAAHNSAGHKPGVKIQPPSMGVMDGIYSDDDSPTRNTDHTPNQESDNSHFSRGNDGVNASTHSNKSNHEKQVQYEKEAQDKVKRKRQHQKNKLAESQRKKDNTECINVDDDDDAEIDNCSTDCHFDGVPTDRVLDPQQQERVDQLKDQFGEEDDYNKIVKRSKNHRGIKHGESSLAAQSSSNSNNPTRMLTKDRKKHQHKREQRDYSSFGRANLERGGGRVMPSHSTDPLDIAVSQQKTDKGSSSNDMAVPKLKASKGGRKKEVVDMGRSVVGQLQKWGGSTKSKREKVAESSKREKQAAAALMRQTHDSSSSGEKRKRSDSAIDVDDDDMMGILAAASNQRYEDKPKKVVELPPLGIGRTADGRVGKGKYKSGEFYAYSTS